MPTDLLPVILEQYRQGTDVHWSSFTSTSVIESQAKNFAGPDGIIFVMSVESGREISAYSQYSTEHEVLLEPNAKFTVTSEVTQRADGFFYLSLQQRSGTVVR